MNLQKALPEEKMFHLLWRPQVDLPQQVVALKITTQGRGKKERRIIMPLKYASHELYLFCLSISSANVDFFLSLNQ